MKAINQKIRNNKIVLKDIRTTVVKVKANCPPQMVWSVTYAVKKVMYQMQVPVGSNWFNTLLVNSL